MANKVKTSKPLAQKPGKSEKGRSRGKRSGREKDPKQFTDTNSSKNERRAAEIEGTAKEVYLSTSNPYAWYANFPNFAKDVATLAFGVPVGQPIYISDQDYVANAGIMTLSFTPTPGYSADLTSPINRQAVRFQSYLRSIQRAASDYDSADTMLYFWGIDSLYTYWAFLRRAYGVAQLFTPTNRYYPRRLLQAMGINPDDILGNLADFRAFINRYALNIGRYALPKTFDLIQRHMWMCSGLYLDSNTTRAQTYLFTPYILWQFNNTTQTGGALIGVAVDTDTSSPTLKSFSDLMQLAETLINNFENDTDTMNISGDLYRAYGADGVISVEETPDSYSVLPVYDETVLSQIENATIVGAFVNQTGVVTMPSITQNPTVNNGAIIFTPSVEFGAQNLSGTTTEWLYSFAASSKNKSIINMHWDSPTPEQVMEATRFVARGLAVDNHGSGTQSPIILRDFGSDVINQVRICVTSQNNPAAVQWLRKKGNTIWKNNNVLNQPADVDWIVLKEQFDWAPMGVIANWTGSGVNFQFIDADVDNFTSCSDMQLRNMHEAALLSLLDIPSPIAH